MKKRFEYKIIDAKIGKWTGLIDDEDLIKKLNKEGMDGWEVIESLKLGGWTNKFILKREI